jgi:hypothetical protein
MRPTSCRRRSSASDVDELLQDRIVEAIGGAVQEAIRDNKRAGNLIAG